ncbi:Asp-tRNA(Asn)/Glu-tRNA(Gln) amidotransferase subunit GatC [Candidatus Woesearchaeota archaeon]|nr:Asp-tRNA(Asn)/Glu-tRNA(Gln) amidotransferase subunit GatC [Candidatus Woesearchaeota archaeon]
MKINKNLIQHIADTARLNLSESEIEELLPQLKEIIDAFSELSEIDTINVKPSFQPVTIKNAMRDDKVKESLSQELALKNTKHKRKGYFQGPGIL